MLRYLDAHFRYSPLRQPASTAAVNFALKPPEVVSNASLAGSRSMSSPTIIAIVARRRSLCKASDTPVTIANRRSGLAAAPRDRRRRRDALTRSPLCVLVFAARCCVRPTDDGVGPAQAVDPADPLLIFAVMECC